MIKNIYVGKDLLNLSEEKKNVLTSMKAFDYIEFTADFVIILQFIGIGIVDKNTTNYHFNLISAIPNPLNINHL